MNHRILLLGLALLSALPVASRAAHPGDPDPSFGAGGTVRIPLAGASANDVLALPDGTILVGGTGDPNGSGITRFLVARLDGTGALVPGFGTGGFVTTAIPLADDARVRRLALDRDGRIVAAGIATTALATGGVSRLLKMTRYFPDGQLDRDFGNDGIRNSASARDVAAIIVTEDHRVAYVGRDDECIGGTEGPGDGRSQFSLPPDSDGADIVAREDGLLIGATQDDEFLLIKTNATITRPVPDFGVGGFVFTPVGTGPARLRKLLVLPDGKIVAVGSTRLGNVDTDLALVRYTAEGELDPSFGNGGIVVTSLGPQRDTPADAALAPDGTMLVTGQTCPTTPGCHGFVARLLPDGRLDGSFGEGGVVDVPGLILGGVALPDDGHVLVVEGVSDELVIHRLVTAECGDGRLEAGEACDDGNATAGDCCSPTCTLEADDTPCADDGSVCTADVCRAGTCTHSVPAEAGCFAATASTLTRTTNAAGIERLRWTWQSTTPVDRASFGDPTTASDLTVCAVDANDPDRPRLEVTVPAAGTCRGVPCWKETGRGFRFKNAGVDGVTRLRLVTAANGSSIELRARNLPGAADLPVPVRVRLIRHDAPTCYEAELAPGAGAALELR